MKLYFLFGLSLMILTWNFISITESWDEINNEQRILKIIILILSIFSVYFVSNENIYWAQNIVIYLLIISIISCIFIKDGFEYIVSSIISIFYLLVSFN